MSQTTERVYDFGPFRLYAVRRVLLRDGRPVALTAKVFETLLVLVEQRGRVVPKDELMDALWPDTSVEENNLTQQISVLRKALGERAGDHRYVVTVPGRGYSFVAEVREAADARADVAAEARNGSRVSTNSKEGQDERTSPVETTTADAPSHVTAHAPSHVATDAPVARTRGVRLYALSLVVLALLSASGIYAWRERAARKESSAAAERRRAAGKRSTESLEAYEAYLRGRHFWNKRDEAGVRKSVEHFRRAIDLDPAYAAAHAGLADAYVVLSAYGYGELTPAEYLERARAAAEKAVAADDTLAEAHASLAVVKTYHTSDAAAAEAEYRRAIELNPSYATARHWYSDFLAMQGRGTEALAEIERASRLDPLSPIISTTLAERFYFARQYERAAEELRKALDLESGFVQARFTLGLVCVQQGRYDAAVAELEEVRRLAGGKDARATAALAHAHATAGRKGQALRLLAELSAADEAPAFEMALLLASLGERERALAWLRKGLDKARGRPGGASIYVADPRFDRFRRDPAFGDLLVERTADEAQRSGGNNDDRTANRVDAAYVSRADARARRAR